MASAETWSYDPVIFLPDFQAIKIPENSVHLTMLTWFQRLKIHHSRSHYPGLWQQITWVFQVHLSTRLLKLPLHNGSKQNHFFNSYRCFRVNMWIELQTSDFQSHLREFSILILCQFYRPWKLHLCVLKNSSSILLDTHSDKNILYLYIIWVHIVAT